MKGKGNKKKGLKRERKNRTKKMGYEMEVNKSEFVEGKKRKKQGKEERHAL